MCVLSKKVPIRKKSGNLFNDPRTACKKFCLIISERSDLHMIDNLSVTVHDFHMRILTLFSIDKVWFRFVSDISTIVGYLKSNPVFTYMY